MTALPPVQPTHYDALPPEAKEVISTLFGADDVKELLDPTGYGVDLRQSMIPVDHPVKKWLDEQFFRSATPSIQDLGHMGLENKSEWSFVAKVPTLPYYIKARLDIPLRSQQDMNCQRITMAKRIKKVAEEQEYADLFIVPKKHLYHIPGRPFDIADENYIVVSEEVPNLLGKDENCKKWQAMEESTLTAIYNTILRLNFANGWPANIVFTEDGKIAWIDTTPVRTIDIVRRPLDPKKPQLAQLADRIEELWQLTREVGVYRSLMGINLRKPESKAKQYLSEELVEKLKTAVERANVVGVVAHMRKAGNKQLLKTDFERFRKMVGLTDDAIAQRFIEFAQVKWTMAEEDELKPEKKISANASSIVNCRHEHYQKALRKVLADELHDSAYVEHILKAFAHHILSQAVCDRDVVFAISIWIVRWQQWLALGPHLLQTLEKDFADGGGIYTDRWIKRGNLEDLKRARDRLLTPQAKRAISMFLQEVAHYSTRVHEKYPRRSKRKQHITFITERNGGGHDAVRRGAVPHLIELGYEVDVVNLHEIREKYDPLARNEVQFEDGTKMSVNETYSQWFAHGRESNLTLLMGNWEIFCKTEFPDRYPDNSNCDLLERMLANQTDLVISTLHFRDDLHNLAWRANVQWMVVHCDYSINSECVKQRAQQMLLPERLRLMRFGISDSKVHGLPEDICFATETAIKIVGLPALDRFSPITDERAIENLRKKWGIHDSNKVYKISRGLLGVKEHLALAVNRFLLSKEHYDKPWDVVVVCGENKEAQKKLQEMTRDYPKEGYPYHFHILGKLSGDEMAELSQIEDINNFKAGGGSSAEFLQSLGNGGRPKFGVAVPHYEWEKCNAEFVEKKGVGVLFDPKDPDPPDIVEELKKADSLEAKPLSLVDWKTELAAAVAERMPAL
ncbi:MAG: Processive diacylglycerol beta-glucosyltransferase [Chlamydiae bacterium]|nr:Processive diacylglycerol beta-glucosyltransferase [Chlamydiota bacterium]